MVISYSTEQDFYVGIENLVKKGLTFDANGSTLTITVTGGY